MNFEYIIALIMLCALYVLGIRLIKFIRNTDLVNYILIALVFVPYIVLCQIVYLDVGFYDWNFQNVLPVANVSPFSFAVIPIVPVLPKRIKAAALRLVCLLTVGMFLSTTFNCYYNAAIGYKFHFHFLLDYVSHFTLSFFGVYLIKTEQVQLTVKKAVASGSIMYSVAVIMMILNVIFDTSFFGLSLNGKHNIYNNVLVESSYLSALLYFLGLGAVMALGFGYCKIFASGSTFDKAKTDEREDCRTSAAVK